MVSGTCHCGAVSWTFEGMPKSATSCTCTVCRRYAVLWAYGHEGENIKVLGPTKAYIRMEKNIGFHFCETCGCIAYFLDVEPDKNGRREIGVNLRLAEPEDVAAIPIRRFDGLTAWKDMPDRGEHVRDLWS
jgi:hypothetical protein